MNTSSLILTIVISTINHGFFGHKNKPTERYRTGAPPCRYRCLFEPAIPCYFFPCNIEAMSIAMFRGKSSAFKTQILESSVDLFRFLAIVSPCFCLLLLLNPDSLWNPSICDIPKLFQYDLKKYHLVIQHSHGKSPCSIGKPSINGPSIPWLC